MHETRRGQLLRIFVGEDDHRDGQPLWEWLLRRARREGLAGATVLRGLAGYGANSRLHTAKVLRLSQDLPMVIEIVDTEEKIRGFLPVVDEAVTEGLATLEAVEVHLYRSSRGGEAGQEEDRGAGEGKRHG